VLTGGKAIAQTGDTSQADQSSPSKPIAALTPAEALKEAMATQNDQGQTTAAAKKAMAAQAQAAAQEEQDFQALKKRIDKLVQDAGLANRVSTTVARRGLKIRLLTDDLFFDSGSASSTRPRSRRSTRSGTSWPRRPSTRSRSRVTRTISPSPHRSTRPTGSCRAPAPAPSCSGWRGTAWTRSA
jgi:hypothetical protein